MKIAIISAMIEELQPLVDYFKLQKINQLNGQTVYHLKNDDNDYYFLNSGIGKVNAAITMTLLIKEYAVEHVLNIGTAGGVHDKLVVADFVVAENLLFHDVNVTSFGYEIGQIPGQDQYFKIKNALILHNYLLKIVNNVHLGNIATGDQFIDTNEAKIRIAKQFTNVFAIEMESAAIVMTCQNLNVDCVVLRTISDLVNSESSYDFNEYLAIVTKNFIILIKQIIKDG